MNKKLFTTLTAGIFAVLSSCSGDVIEADPKSSSSVELSSSSDDPASNPIQTTAALTVVVRDSVTGLTLDGVNVTLLSTNEALTTENGGVAVFDSVRVGEHRLLLEGKTGYVEKTVTASIGQASVEGVYIARDAQTIINLAPLTSTLVGYVYYQDKDGKEQPAPGVAVRLLLTPTDLLNRTVFDTTDAEGKYTFEKLPAYGYSLMALVTEIGGITYNNATIGTTALEANTTTFITAKTTLSASSGQSLFSLVNYYSNVLQDDNRDTTVVFIFSDEIDAAQFKTDMIRICYGITATACSSTDAVANISINKDTIFVKPVDKWKASFKVSFNNLKSVKGKTVSSTNPVIVRLKDLTDKKVEGFGIAQRDGVYLLDSAFQGTSSSIRLTWKKIDGATSYVIYRKVDGEDQDAYTAASTIATTANVQDTMIRSVTTNGAINSRTAKFLIQAINEDSKTVLDEADTVVVRDNMKPKWGTFYNPSSYALASLPKTQFYLVGDGTWHNDSTISFYSSATPRSFASNWAFDNSNHTLNTFFNTTTTEDVDYTYTTSTYFTFSENMNTDVLPTISCANDGGNAAGAARVKMEGEWVTETSLYLRLKLLKGAALETTDLNVKCSVNLGVLKDKTQGNLLETFAIEYTGLPESAIPTYNRTKTVNNTLDFRFITTLY